MKTTFEDDLKRRQLARNFTAFVMDIIRDNIERGGDERSLHRDLETAAYEADMQWMPAEAFRLMKAYEKIALDQIMMSPLPPVLVPEK